MFWQTNILCIFNKNIIISQQKSSILILMLGTKWKNVILISTSTSFCFLLTHRSVPSPFKTNPWTVLKRSVIQRLIFVWFFPNSMHLNPSVSLSIVASKMPKFPPIFEQSFSSLLYFTKKFHWVYSSCFKFHPCHPLPVKIGFCLILTWGYSP